VRRKTLYLLIALAGILMATPVALVRFRGLSVVSASPAANMVVGVSEVVTSWSPVSEHPLRLEGVEAAERINQELMRRRREEWERTFPLREQGR
jgi:hypothetical protein